MSYSHKRIVEDLGARGWLTIHQLSRLVQVAYPHLYALVSSGEIEGYQLTGPGRGRGGWYRIGAQEVIKTCRMYRHKNQYAIDQAIQAANAYLAKDETA